MDQSICESNDSNDIMLYNVLYVGGEKSQKTLIEMKEVQEENSIIMNNEIKEYEVVNELIHEKIESLPEIAGNLNDSTKNILNIDENVSMFKSQKSKDNHNIDESNNYSRKYSVIHHNNKNNVDYANTMNNNKTNNFNNNSDDNYNMNDDNIINNKSNNINIINNDDPINNYDVLSLHKHTSEYRDNSLTGSGMAKIKSILSKNTKDEINFDKNTPLNSLYNINTSKINISLLKNKIEKQRLALSDMNLYVVTDNVSNMNKKVRDLSYSEGSVLKNHNYENYLFRRSDEANKKDFNIKLFLEKKSAINLFENEKYMHLHTDKNENIYNKGRNTHDTLNNNIKQDIISDKEKIDDTLIKISNNICENITVNKENNQDVSSSVNNTNKINISSLIEFRDKNQNTSLKGTDEYSTLVDLLNDLESSTKSIKEKFLINNENSKELKKITSTYAHSLMNNKNKINNEINEADDKYFIDKEGIASEFNEYQENFNMETNKNEELKEHIYSSKKYRSHGLFSDSKSSESKIFNNEHDYKNDVLLEKHICDLLNNKYLENLTFKETKKHSDILQNFKDTTEILLKFSKISIGKHFQDKLENYEKFYISYCIPVISKTRLNQSISKKRRRSLNSSYPIRNKSSVNFFLRNKKISSKIEANEKNKNKNGKVLIKKVFENKYKNISRYRNLTDIKKKNNIDKENIMYDSFSIENKHIDKNYIEFLENVYHKVHDSILDKTVPISFLLCANLNKKKKKKIGDSTSCILHQKNLNILKLLNYPFIIPNNSEILGFAEIPFIPFTHLEIPIKELVIPNNCFTDFIKGPFILFYMYLGIFEKTTKKENETEIGNKMEKPSRNTIDTIEKMKNYDLNEEFELKITSNDKTNNLDKSVKNLSNFEDRDLKKSELNLESTNIKEAEEFSDASKGTNIMHTNLQEEKKNNEEYFEIDKSILERDEEGKSIENEKENNIKKSRGNNLESDYEKESVNSYEEEKKKTKKDMINKCDSDYIKEKRDEIPEEDDKNEVLYIYIDKIVNLSKKIFSNMLICVRFYKDEKYTYKSFNLKEEKICDILLNSKKRLCDIQEIFIEVWNSETNNRDGEDCIGILKINVTEINENKNIMYLEKYSELTFRFYEDINFMFRIILIRGLKNMYENIKEFCKEYIENYETDARKFLLNEDSKANSQLNSITSEDRLNMPNSFLSINEQYFIYDSANIYNNEYYIYEIQREILKKDIRSSTVVNNIISRKKYKINIKGNNIMHSELNSKLKKKVINKNNDNKNFSKKCDIMIHSDDTTNQYVDLLKSVNGEIVMNENNMMHIEIESIKEELLLCGMNEHTVKLLISDLRNNSIKSKYVLKSYFEEYIDKIYNKWEKLSNKLFIKNKKKMLLNDICEYLDNLYLDDENYLNKEEFLLFFQDVGIVFVDSTVFDELCLLFYDNKKEKIHFSLFASLIIKKGVEELKNMVYGYDILLKLFEFLYINNITIEYLENELFKIMLQKKNYYSEKIRQNISTDILINSNIDCRKSNENLKLFLKEEDNICSCTSLIFLHSIQFILKKFNNNDFTTYDLFFLVKYIVQNQYNYIDSESSVFINVIKGIETVNITFFLCLYYIYINQNNNKNVNNNDSNNYNNNRNNRINYNINETNDENCMNEKKNSFNKKILSNDEEKFSLKDSKTINYNSDLHEPNLYKRRKSKINRASHNSRNEKENNFPIQKNVHSSSTHSSKDSVDFNERDNIRYESINSNKENYKDRKKDEKSNVDSCDSFNLNKSNKENFEVSSKKEKLTISMLRNNDHSVYCKYESDFNSSHSSAHSINEENALIKSSNHINIKKNKSNYSDNIVNNNFNENCHKRNSIDKRDSDYIIESSMDNDINSYMNCKNYKNRKNYNNKTNVLDIFSKENENKNNLNYETNMISAYNSINKKRILMDRKEIKRAVKNTLVIIYNRIVSGLITVEYIAECLYNYYKIKIMLRSKTQKKVKREKIELLRLFDHLGIYTSYDIAKSILKWYKNEIYKNNETNKNSYLSINGFSNFSLFEEGKVLNNAINYHINNINKIINKYLLSEETSGNVFSGSTLKSFFILLKERNININIFSKKNIFTFNDFSIEIEKLNINFSKSYIRLLFCNLLTYDLTSFNSLNNKLIFFDSLESYWLSWNKLNFDFSNSRMDIKENTEHILNNIKDKRRKLAVYNKKYGESSLDKARYFSYTDLQVLNKKQELLNKQRSSSEKNINDCNFFFLPLYSFFFYFSEEELLSGGKLIKHFFLNIFRYEINSLNINTYMNKYYYFYDFLQVSKDMILYNYEHNDNDLFREDFLKLIILINNTYLKKRCNTTFKLQNFIQRKTHLFSKNFKNNLSIIIRDIINLEKNTVDISVSMFDVYQSNDTRDIVNLNEERNVSKDALILNFFKKNRYIIKYIREYFYIFIFLNKVMNNKNYNLCFYEKESIIYQKKLKECYTQKMKNIQDKFNNIENKYLYEGFQSNWRNKLNYFPFLYQEVNICFEEKKFSSKEYIHFVYPYLLLLCDFLKRVIHIYKNEYKRYINKLFNLDYEKASNRMFFLHNVENIMARSGSFDSKEWNKIFSFLEIFNIKMSDFLLNLWKILKDNNFILYDENESIIFNEKNDIWNLINNDAYAKGKVFLSTEERKDIFIKNLKYFIAFDKVILYDLNNFNQKRIHNYIINDNVFVTYLSYLYIRILFNDCISTGLNINKLFHNIKTKSSFINVLSKNFGHVFSPLDIDLFAKKYSFLIDMPSLHLSSYQNYISSSNFIKDLYRQGEYYNIYLRNKLFHFFLNNKSIFMKNDEGMENQHLISCDNLKSILSENGIFLSWAELYDFFQPLNKFCVIYDYKKYQFNKTGKPTPYILKAYINFSNLIVIAEKKYKKDIQKASDNETQKAYKNEIHYAYKDEIKKDYKNKISTKYNNNNNMQNEYNMKMQKKILDIKKAVSKDTWKKDLYNYKNNSNNRTIINEKGTNVDGELSKITYAKMDKDICKNGNKNINENYSEYNNHSLISYVDKNKEKITLKNSEVNNNKQKSTKCKKIYMENGLKDSNKKEEKKNYISHDFRKFSNFNSNLFKTSNNLYYNFSFNNLNLERILFFLFLKMSNLMIKKKLKYEQIYFGIKNIKEQHIKKKEIESVCYFLLNIEKKELNNIIPDDFILYEKDLKNGIYLNTFILKKEFQNIFAKFNSPVISIFDFIHFFEKKKKQVTFSNYMFTYNFSYEWINYMNVQNELISKDDCIHILNIFHLEDFNKEENNKEKEAIKESLKINNEVCKNNLKKKEESNIDKEQNNNNIINKSEVIQYSNIRNSVKNSKKNKEEHNSNYEPINNEEEQKKGTLYNIIFKEEMIKIFEKNIKGKWKKLLLPIFNLKSFYLHDFKILLDDFTGIKKLFWKIKENNQIKNEQKEGKFSLSYFCCFGKKEILIEDILNSEKQNLKYGNSSTFNDTVYVNYAFEHKFSTIKEKDLIPLFENNKQILNLKLFYNQNKIAEASLHILEFFSIMKYKEKKDHKILCFVSTDDEYKEILFLDIDVYYKREKLFSNLPVFETSYKKVDNSFKIENYNSNKNNMDFANSNYSIKEKCNNNTEELLTKNKEKPNSKNTIYTDKNKDRKDNNERCEENISILEYSSEKKEIISKKNHKNDYILVEKDHYVEKIKNGNKKYNIEGTNSLVSMQHYEYNNKMGNNIEESIIFNNCKKENNYFSNDEKRNMKHELEITSINSNERKRESNKEESDFVSYLNLTIDRIILPFYLLKDLNNKFSEVKETNKTKDEIFIAFYIEIYQKEDEEEKKDKYKLLSCSVPRIVNYNKEFVSNDNHEKNDSSFILNTSDNSRNKNNASEKDTLRKSEEVDINKIKKDMIDMGKDKKINECNSYSENNCKEEVHETSNKYKNNIINLDNKDSASRNNNEKSYNKSLEMRKKKKKEKKFKLFDKYINIYNLKIKHNEVIKSKNLYVEGKIIIRALISLNYNSEDLIIGEHYFKIKNILYENKNIKFCSENLLYGINGKYFLHEDDKDTKVDINNSVIENSSSDYFLMKDNSINKGQVKITEEEDEETKKEEKKLSNNNTFVSFEGSDNTMIKYNNENDLINNIKQKKVIGYILYTYQIEEAKYKNCKKRNKFLIPNFIKIYFIKYDKCSLKKINERNNALHNTIYEKIFSDVLRKVNYRKYVNIEMFLESLKNTNYSNDINYFEIFFHYFINSDNTLYFPLETMLIILALRRLSFHFINSLNYFFDEIQKYFSNSNELGIVEWAYLLKCILKSQNKFIITEKKKKEKDKEKEKEPFIQNSLHVNSNFSSTSTSFSSLPSTSKDNSISYYDDEEKKMQKKRKIKRKILNEKDWYLLNNWKKWHLYNNNKNYFFLYLFLNDIIVFYEEYKNFIKPPNYKISSFILNNRKNMKNSFLLNEKRTNKKKKLLNRKNEDTYLDGNEINSFKNIKEYFQKSKINEENAFLSENNNDNNGYILPFKNKNISKSNLKDEKECHFFSNEIFDIKNKKKSNEHSILSFYKNKNIHSYYMKKENEKCLSENTSNALYSDTSNSKLYDFIKNKYNHKKTSIYQYNILKNKNIDKYTGPKNNYRSMFAVDSNIKSIKHSNINIENNCFKKDNNLNENKYKIYVKIKKILHPLPLINNKKPNIFFSFKIVLNNYDFINKNDIFPFLINSKKNYIINKVQAKSSIFFNECYPSLNISAILKLPSCEELNKIFSISMKNEDFNFCLKNVSLQICIYHVINNFIVDLKEHNMYDKKSIYYSSSSSLITHKNTSEFNRTKEKIKKKILIANTFIPLSVLLNKNKTKINAPLIFSPFFTSNNYRNFIEVVLKYDNTKERNKFFLGDYYRCLLKKKLKDDASETIHNHNIQELENNKKNKGEIIKNSHDTYTKNNLRNNEKKEFIDFFNIPLLTLPKIPPPIS